MLNRKRAFWATTALFTGLLAAGTASAQSTGTIATESETRVDDVVVTGRRGPLSIDGAIVAETIGKTRSTITQDYLQTQAPGQTVLQSLNLIPGLVFNNADPYGSSGGNVRLRGFDGNRVSLTFDGIPLNDTGNYAIYTNQQLDPELIQQASINQGTTDVDSPTASAVGGTINYTVSRPTLDPQVQVVSGLGEFNYGRVFLRADTGEFGPWGTTAYATVSYTNYDKFKGPGELEKTQFNGRVYQDLGNGNFASISGHYNRNRNNFYNNFINQANFAAGTYLENDINCFRPLGVNGTVQNESNQSVRILSDGTTALGSCTNYHGLRINPSNTGNIRGQFSYGLTDNLRFTFDPSYQFVMANGGGFTLVSERDDRLDRAGPVGVDLNGDGDTLDNVGLYTPSNTNTNRYGVTSSLIWDVNDDHRFRVAYTVDYGRHRQTGEATRFTQFSEPLNVFGGQRLYGDPTQRVLAVDGYHFRSRDRASIAELQQFAVEYRGQFFDDALTVRIGARAPEFTRELNQYCFSQNGRSTVRCTSETPTVTLANGNVRFASTGTTEWIAPYSTTLSYDEILPNVDANFRFGNGHSIYASYAEGLSAPRTDNLYQPKRNADGSLSFSSVLPETSQSFDLGYRYASSRSIVSVALWQTSFQNRIVSSRDLDPASPFFNEFIDRNLGDVEQWGLDAQAGYELFDGFSVYASAAYNDSEVQDDIQTGPATFLLTKGKTIVETPDWTFAGRVDWQATPDFNVGLQGKYVGRRFSTDINDEEFPEYTVFDLDARYDLTDTFGIKNAFIQLNVINLFEERYQANISTGNSGFRTGSEGSPRTAMITLGTTF